MPINHKQCQCYLEAANFTALFTEELGWDRIKGRDSEWFEIEVDLDCIEFETIAIAQKRGFVAYRCDLETMPELKVRKQLDRLVSELTKAHLLVFVSPTEHIWMWQKPEGGKYKLRSQTYQVGKSAKALIEKLEALSIAFEEEDDLTLVDVTSKVKRAFDIERVTKQFFQDFEGLHARFCLEIGGIESEADRRWYGSVVLNRLMFVYFLQKRAFLDRGNTSYLQDKLGACEQTGEGFYGFLKDLFFKGFALPDFEPEKQAIADRIGKICYLNGGLFLAHTIESRYGEAITITDQAFREVFSLFERYQWHLDDRPDADKDSDEINPDVLGYIFEKYINQKEFGAYYTRPEITGYLCDRTVNTLVVDRANALGYGFGSITEVLAGLDGRLCGALLGDILPSLRLLDPACGSGAFLVAAMKTLIGIYEAVMVAARGFSSVARVAAWLEEAGRHPSADYYIKKRIITDNLYGVDIMEEATEIAKLRLFLALVASARRVEDLEPLPNVDFNIMAGNSLIGLIRVDAEGFDQLTHKSKNKADHAAAIVHEPTQGLLLEPTVLQGNLLQSLAASAYAAILDQKNKSIRKYKEHAFRKFDPNTSQETRLLMLRQDIEKLNRESQAKLNVLLLEEFNNLKIKYEEKRVTGKGEKRLLNIADMEALEPFHWGYHFDSVFAQGGFDAIIANPPWEVFKPNAKEFFAQHSELVTKNKMDIKAFEKEQKTLLEKSGIATAWCKYQSKFPHVSLYYRGADLFRNQISLVNGRKQGTDINLYKLFLEQCFNLLRDGGRCGIILPTGIYTDLGAKQLREMLFSQCRLDNLFSLSNERFIFEGVDHRFKFCLIDFEKGKKTEEFNTTFRIDPREAIRPNELGTFLYDRSQQLKIPVSLVQQLSPDSLSVMEFKQAIDIQIAKKMAQYPLLGEKLEDTWNLKLTAEFHMTNDSHLFKTEPAPGRLPLYEGKMIHQFTHQFAEPRYWVDEAEGRRSVLGKRGIDQGQQLDYQGYRLGFRDIARNTDARTAISTITAHAFHGNKSPNSKIYDDDGSVLIQKSELLILCSVFNSFVFDWLIRQRVSSTLNFFYVYQMPVPRLQKGDRWFNEIVHHAARLICTTPDYDTLAQEIGLDPLPLTPSPKMGEGEQEQRDNNAPAPLSRTGRGAGGEGKIYGTTDETERAHHRAQLDGIIAHLYHLTETEFRHILSTFPIVPDATKQAAIEAYRAINQQQ
jgi:hypothetical protein